MANLSQVPTRHFAPSLSYTILKLSSLLLSHTINDVLFVHGGHSISHRSVSSTVLRFSIGKAQSIRIYPPLAQPGSPVTHPEHVTMTTNAEPSNDSQIPDMAFQLFKKGLGNGASRLGRLSLTQRKPIETPNYIATTSRGTIPHITPDNISKHVSFGGAYMALEDCTFSNFLGRVSGLT